MDGRRGEADFGCWAWALMADMAGAVRDRWRLLRPLAAADGSVNHDDDEGPSASERGDLGKAGSRPADAIGDDGVGMRRDRVSGEMEDWRSEEEPKMRRCLREGEAAAGEKGMEISPSSGRGQRMEDGGVDGKSFFLVGVVGRRGSVNSASAICYFCFNFRSRGNLAWLPASISTSKGRRRGERKA